MCKLYEEGVPSHFAERILPAQSATTGFLAGKPMVTSPNVGCFLRLQINIFIYTFIILQRHKFRILFQYIFSDSFLLCFADRDGLLSTCSHGRRDSGYHIWCGVRDYEKEIKSCWLFSNKGMKFL